MRNFMRPETSMLFFFACVLATQVSCSADTTIDPGAPVATITVALDASMLSVGHTAQASATVKDSAGNPINGQTVSWASQDTGVAKVSAEGAVTAVAVGSTVIEGKIAGTTGVAPLTVVGPPNLAFHDFNDGTRGPFSSSNVTKVTFPDDPTGSGRGKVARIYYAPTLANRSDDEYVNYRTHDAGKIRYGRTIWFKGEVYLPTNPLNDPNWRALDGRKLLDWQGSSDDGWTGGGARWFLGRGPDGNAQGNPIGLGVLVESRTTVNGVDQGATVQYYSSSFANNLVPFDTWHTLEVRMITNSADQVHDGSLAFWLNNPTDIPTFQTPSTLYFINEAWAPNGVGGIPVVGSYFNDFRVGEQLSNRSPLPLNTEYRYWDNIAFSTTRIGN